MDKIKSRRVSPLRSTVSFGTESELPSPQEKIESLGPDAFTKSGKKEPEEGAKDLHRELIDFAEKSPELSPELVSPEAPEAFFLGAGAQLKHVEEDMGEPNSNASLDERVDFSRGVTAIHCLLAGEEIKTVNEAASEREIEQKIAKAVKQYSSEPSA